LHGTAVKRCSLTGELYDFLLVVTRDHSSKLRSFWENGDHAFWWQTNRQTDKETDKPIALSRSCCHTWRLNNQIRKLATTILLAKLNTQFSHNTLRSMGFYFYPFLAVFKKLTAHIIFFLKTWSTTSYKLSCHREAIWCSVLLNILLGLL